MPEEKVLTPIQGVVIDTSRGTLIFIALCAGLLGFASGFVLWDTWSHKEAGYILPFHLAKDSLFTSFVVGLCTFGGVGGFIGFLCNSLFPQQVILGEQVLQVTATRGFSSTVEIQVPYSNIAAVTCERETDGLRQMRVGIDLLSRDSAGTYRRHDFGEKDQNERDFYLPGFLTTSPEEIAKLLAERLKSGSDGSTSNVKQGTNS